MVYSLVGIFGCLEMLLMSSVVVFSLWEGRDLAFTAVVQHGRGSESWSTFLKTFSVMEGMVGMVKTERQIEQRSSVGKVSRPGPKQRSSLAWLPLIAAEWQGVRCGHSGASVGSGLGADYGGALIWSSPLRFSRSTVWQKQPCEETVYGLCKWIWVSAPCFTLPSQTTELLKRAESFSFML